jgi:protein-S-isoprenylcysteine O-methyltransferase Ste14
VQDRVIPEINLRVDALVPGQRDAGSTRTSTWKTFALEWVINVIVQLTIAVWLTLEAGLLIRDRVRGKGSAARDRGTLWLNVVIITAAVVAAGILTGVLQNAAAWQFGSAGLSVAGLLVMWAGLAVRIWAIVVLGRSFRMTVEVDTGQKVIDSGPYRWVRHPSYTGVLLLMAGLSLVYGDWPALAILLVLPAGVLIHRIFVEEAVLTEVMGRAYTDYAARTKRLVPGLW